MSVIELASIIHTGLWPQLDARDPLGIWGGLVVATGDASGGIIDFFLQVPAALRTAYIHTIISAGAYKVSGTSGEFTVKRRVITQWPDIDPATPLVQAYEDIIFNNIAGADSFTDPINMPSEQMIKSPLDKMLLFDFQRSTAALTLVAFQIADNELAAVYRAQAYGYFWDREVLNAPGGPRHPGSS